MPRIELRNEIKANKKIVFDLSQIIDLHKTPTDHTIETSIAGKTKTFNFITKAQVTGFFKPVGLPIQGDYKVIAGP
jgi:hypothetical protein